MGHEERQTRLRYRFLFRRGNTYYWEMVAPGSSRTQQFRCPIDWFWGRRR